MLPHRFIGFPAKFSESSLHAPEHGRIPSYSTDTRGNVVLRLVGRANVWIPDHGLSQHACNVPAKQDGGRSEPQTWPPRRRARPFACNAPFPRQFAFLLLLLLLPRCKRACRPSLIVTVGRWGSRVSQHYLANSLSGVGEFPETCCSDLKSPRPPPHDFHVSWTARPRSMDGPRGRIIVSDIAVSWERKTSRCMELTAPPSRGISLSLGGEGRRKVETHSFQLLGDDEIIINRIWIQLVETCVRDV